jgi:diguanylate cyclase (GGDEF)-like protein/PAS domain S-box-containing protein
VTGPDAREDPLRPSQISAAIVAGASVGIVVVDRELRCLLWNRFMESLTGVTAEALLGRPLLDALPHLRDQELPAILARALAGETVVSYDVRWPEDARAGALAGTYAPYPDGTQPVAGATVTLRNVSERREAEHALRESEERYRRLIELSPDAIAIHSDGRLVFCNRAGAQMLGYADPEEVVGRSVIEFVHPDSRAVAMERMRLLMTEGRPLPFIEEKFVRRDGTILHAEVGAVPFSLRDRPAVQVVIRDVSQRQRDQKLQAALYRIAQITGAVSNMHTLYEEVHRTVGELMNARNFYIALYDEASGLLSFPYFVDEMEARPPDPYPLGQGVTEKVLRSGQPLLTSPPTFAQMRRAGDVELVGHPSVDWMGVPLKRGSEAFGVIALQSYDESVRYTPEDLKLLAFVSRQVATALDRRQAEDALKESEARFRTLADTAPCAIFIYQGTRIVYANAFMEALSGYSREELQGMNFWDTVHPDFRNLVRLRGLARQEKESMPGAYEFKFLRQDGSERWVQFSASSIDFGGRAAALGTAFDITERKRAEEQIRNLAYHDALTGLPNRLLFQDRLSVAVAQAHRLGHRVAVLFLDVDRFKMINDSLGHSRGDRLLQQVSERLSLCVREGDTVARLGGDEFTLILPGLLKAEDVAKVADKILESLRQPFQLEGRELYVTASIGVSLFPDDGRDTETLLKYADTAMYRAKEQGRDGYQLYQVGMTETAVSRLAAESSFRRAAAQKELVVYYQPLCEIGSGSVYGVEALLRWHSPDSGVIPPSEFIGLAEVTGLILPIGGWVLKTACAQVVEWHRQGHEGLALSVNLSARQFLQPDLVAQVKSALQESALPPHLLELEITETSAMQNAESTVETLYELKALGVRVAIDDFGVGHSSLGYLKRLPIDSLKIDHSFVRDITTDPDDAAIATAVIALAHTLKLTVVAEGVETTEQLAFLRDRRCDRMQGYLLSPPLPADACLRFLDRRPVAPAPHDA